MKIDTSKYSNRFQENEKDDKIIETEQPGSAENFVSASFDKSKNITYMLCMIGLVLRDLPELPVQSLDDTHRVYDFPNFRRVFKEGAQNFPVFFPGLDTGGGLFLPGISKPAQIFLRLVQGDGGLCRIPGNAL